MLSSLFPPKLSAYVPFGGEGSGGGCRLCRRFSEEMSLTSASLSTSFALLLSAASASDIGIG